MRRNELNAPKTLVVTGGASGIGEATVRHFSRLGWRVLIADRNADLGARLAAELAAMGANVTFSPLDVASEADVEAYCAASVRDHGRIHAVVNSAGILENAIRLAAMPMREYDEILAVNLRGAVLMGRAFGKQLCAQGEGAIVHLCSMTSIRPSAQPAYAVSKAGLKMLTEVMAAEFGPHGVRVNAVAPGYTLTPAMRERVACGERDPKLVVERSALRRFVEPEDVAEAIGFLCSDAARSITGVMLPVDCGWLAYAAYSAYATMPQD